MPREGVAVFPAHAVLKPSPFHASHGSDSGNIGPNRTGMDTDRIEGVDGLPDDETEHASSQRSRRNTPSSGMDVSLHGESANVSAQTPSPESTSTVSSTTTTTASDRMPDFADNISPGPSHRAGPSRGHRRSASQDSVHSTTTFASAPTHHQVQLTHCLNTGQWQCIPQRGLSRPCPMCFETPSSGGMEYFPSHRPIEVCDTTPQSTTDDRSRAEARFGNPPQGIAMPEYALNPPPAASSEMLPYMVAHWDEHNMRRSATASIRSDVSDAGCRYMNMEVEWTRGAAFRRDFKRPHGIAYNMWNKNIYLSDTDNHRIVVMSSNDGTPTQQFGDSGRNCLQFPHGIAISDRDEVIVADKFNHRVQIYDQSGHHLRNIGGIPQPTPDKPAPVKRFDFPMGVEYIDGQIFVCDQRCIQSFRYNGNFVRVYNTNIVSPWAITKGPNNSFLILDSPLHRVFSFGSDGRQQRWFSTQQSGPEVQPGALAVDGDGFTLISNSSNRKIDVFKPGSNRYCCSFAVGSPVADMAVLDDGRVVAICGNTVKMFREIRTPQPSLRP